MQLKFVRELDAWARVKLIRSVLERFTADELAKALDKSKSTVYRYAKGEVIPNEEVIVKVLTLLPMDVAFTSVGKEVLKAYGLLDREGKPRLVPLLAILSVALGDPLLRKIILEWISRALGNEVLELKPKSALVMRWDEGFEQFLMEKGISEDKLKDYRSYFRRFLEGKVLSEEFVEEAARFPGWARVVFRHYLNWLALERRADMEFVNWALKRVKSHSYGKKVVKVHEISPEEVKVTLEKLKQENKHLYWLYRLMLESGLRLAHALELIENWNPNEKVFVEPLGKVEERCKCFEAHCRCWLGIKRGKKSALWAFMGKETFKLSRR